MIKPNKTKPDINTDLVLAAPGINQENFTKLSVESCAVAIGVYIGMQVHSQIEKELADE